MRDPLNLFMILATGVFLVGAVVDANTDNELHCSTPKTLVVESRPDGKVARCVDIRGDVVK